jgi:hypothetical protein
MQKLCSQCGAPFECKQSPGCWCADLPWTVPVPSDRTDNSKGCLCPNCLPEKIGLREPLNITSDHR